MRERSRMKPLLALPSIALLAMSVNACGNADKRTGSAPQSPSSATAADTEAGPVSRIAPTKGYLRGDADADETNHKDEDDYSIRTYGHAASAADERAIATLVKRYYVAAAGGDGSIACSLIYSGLVMSPNLGEAAEAAYPPAPGVPPLRGESCARIMSLLFKEDQERLAADINGMEVTSVRVKSNRGLALLGFRTMPERQIPVRREGGTWKMEALLDEELP
jgi:hypothetical protein